MRSMLIHPTAVIDPAARVHPTVRVGPFSVIDANVEVGEGCVLGPHVYLTGWTRVGARNHFHAGAVIGDAPQDLKYGGAPTRIRIGDDNCFRENVTVHRATKEDGETVIGRGCMFMAGCHVGHNCLVGNEAILANGALLGGHVHVGDKVFISGNCLVHQFVRIGRFALMQGGSAISKDLPPFTIARGDNAICGLNVIGLRRAGFDPAKRLALKRTYHLLFRRGLSRDEAVRTARTLGDPQPACMELIDFVSTSKRGICADVGRISSPGDLPQESESESESD